MKNKVYFVSLLLCIFSVFELFSEPEIILITLDNTKENKIVFIDNASLLIPRNTFGSIEKVKLTIQYVSNRDVFINLYGSTETQNGRIQSIAIFHILAKDLNGKTISKLNNEITYTVSNKNQLKHYSYLNQFVCNEANNIFLWKHINQDLEDFYFNYLHEYLIGYNKGAIKEGDNLYYLEQQYAGRDLNGELYGFSETKTITPLND